MSKRIDLTGQTFGYLTVLKFDQEATYSHSGGNAYWQCQCQCGNIISVSGARLRNGNTKSCGCYRKITARQNTFQDLTNQKFGKLLVLRCIGSDNNKRALWECKCDCGNIGQYNTNVLTTGNTLSCGCLHKEIVSQKCSIDLTNQKFGLLTALKPTNKRIDDKIVWECKCECGNICEKVSSRLISGHVKSCGCLHSKGELEISNILIKNNINFIKEYTFDELLGDGNKPLRFDFYLPDYNRLVEFDGEQHFHPVETFGGLSQYNLQLKYDELKKQYAQAKQISLVRIPYTQRTLITIDDILGNKFLI